MKDGLCYEDCPAADSFLFLSLSLLESLLSILDRVWSNRGEAFEPLKTDTDICLLIDDILLDLLLFSLFMGKLVPRLLEPDFFFDPKRVFALPSFFSGFSWWCKIDYSRFTGSSGRPPDL